MPNRILREGILACERTDKLSVEAELFFRRLMSKADDFGRFPTHPSLLRAALYPLRLDAVTAEDIIAWRNECEQAGLIESFSSGRKECLEILDFKQRRRSASKYPRPGDDPVTDDCQTNDGQMHSSASPSAQAEALTSNECEREPTSIRSLIEKIGGTPSNSDSEFIKNRPDSPLGFDRDDIIGSIQRMLGQTEWKQNARMWKKRFREHPAALSLALEDLAAQAPTKVFHINKAAWLTARFKEALLERKQKTA